MSFLTRDFLETPEGLIFAVVDAMVEDGKVLCFLRYVREGRDGRPRKLDTEAANHHLHTYYPGYLHHSARLDAGLHAVPESRVSRHYRPRRHLQDLLRGGTEDWLEARLCRLVACFAQRGLDPAALGVTGSLLIRAHTRTSDIDLVTYSRSAFFAAREIIRAGIADGLFVGLDGAAWQEVYRRRGCVLGFADFVWHERRKANKALFEGTKFDLTQVAAIPDEPAVPWCKSGATKLTGVVRDDAAAFDSPARYRIDHPDIPEILVFTQTYVGQAVTGERIEAAGQVERDPGGRRRLVIGSSREAPGEYLKVLRPPGDREP